MRLWKAKTVILNMIILLMFTSCVKENNKENLNKKYQANEEEMNKVYCNTTNNEMMIGIWEGPRKHAMKSQEDADKRYKEIKDAGINMIFVYAELNDDNWLQKTMQAAENNDIKLIIDLGAVYTNKAALYSALDRTKDSKAVIGYNIIDEPGYKLFGTIKKIRDIIKDYAGENMIVLCNLFPNYAPSSALAENSQENMTAYQTYLDTFIQKANPDILHFDYYPYSSDKASDKNSISKMLLNLNDIRNAGAKYGVTTGGFLQSCRWGKYNGDNWSGTRIPNEIEYRFIMNIHILFGCDTVTNFLYWSRDGSDPDQRVTGIFDGLITYQGEQTEVYNIVKNQNKAIHAMKGVFLDYEHRGFMAANLDDIYKNSISSDLLFDEYKGTTLSSEGEILAGCFEKDNKTGLYVMNFKFTEGGETEVKVNLSGLKEYKVWGSDGLEKMGKSDELHLDLLPSEACFIEIINE